jgi:hypothetical protein
LNDSGGSSSPDEYSIFPINIFMNTHEKTDLIKIEGPADFIIKKDGKIKYVIINGFLHNLENLKGEIRNGLIFK